MIDYNTLTLLSVLPPWAPSTLAPPPWPQTLMFQLGDEDEMDSFVLAIGTKKTLQKMQKEYKDLVRK